MDSGVHVVAQETRIPVKNGASAEFAAANDPIMPGKDHVEKVKFLQREPSGSFKIMGLTPSAELVAISMGEEQKRGVEILMLSILWMTS